MIKKRKIKLTIFLIIILSLILGGVALPLDIAFSQEVSLNKSVNKSTAKEGDILSYILFYRNTDSSSASGVVISDDYDENLLDIYDNNGGTVAGGKISWDIGTLEPGSFGTKIFKVKIKDGLPLGTSYIYNKAIISSNETDPLESNIVNTRVTVRNQYPSANAGPDKKIQEGRSITLSGSGTDPDEDSISYQWSCSGGYLSDPYIPRPTFTAPQVSYHRTYTCTLRVTDDKGLSDYDKMEVRVINEISSPDVETNSGINIQTTSAVLTGYLKDLGGADSCKVWFQWGRNSSYDNETSHRSQSKIGSFNAGIYNLSPNTTYYFRAVVENSVGNSYGIKRSFKTEGTNGAKEEDKVFLSVEKSVKNLSRGDTKWYHSYRSADPSDKLLFQIKIESTGDTKARNVMVKDSLPDNIIYKGNLRIDNVYSSKNISTKAINIGDLSPGQSKIITFEAKVASKTKFSYGTTNLINTGRAYNTETSDSDTCKVIVTRKAVAGTVTETGTVTDIPTGISNGILDSILFPLIITLTIVWIFRSKLIGFDKWSEKRKKETERYRANKLLKKKIAQLKTQGIV